MAIIDAESKLSVAQAVTAAAFTTNVVAAGSVAGDNIADGEPVYLELEVTEAVTSSGGSATVDISLRSNESENPSTGTNRIHMSTSSLAQSVLVAGYKRAWAIPRGASLPYLKHVFARYTPSETLTAGKFNLRLMRESEAVRTYPHGVTYPA